MAGADHAAGGASQRSAAALLSTATDRLERALERVDLEDEPEVADQIIEAMEAADEAETLASETGDQRRRAKTLTH
ncbi:hypothetical protein [Natronoarchaeum rubrum]|uniref:hypothetical protein n=1 Tax=Natronoarchaeum rubrum TaxID=755311 RepID=UPI002111188E|nr:hypothetical protein [Natronoarchaeum rubrum]